jgi:non-ribosomal peptide synthetase component F
LTPQSHLVRRIRERVSELGDRAAHRVQRDGRWRATSWRTLGRAVDGCARALIRGGHQPGEMVVGVHARNTPEWTQADLGILAARGVSVPICPTSAPDQASYILRDARIRLLFVGEQPQFDRALELLSAGEISRIVALDERVDLRGCRQACHLQDFIGQGDHPPSEQELRRREVLYRTDDLLTLIYTSGTTGELRERHAEKLVPARAARGVVFAVVSRDARLKGGLRHVVHHLREDGAACQHAALWRGRLPRAWTPKTPVQQTYRRRPRITTTLVISTSSSDPSA